EGGGGARLGREGFCEGDEPWKRRVAAVARAWFPAGAAQGKAGAALGPEGPERAIRRAGFVAVATHEFTALREWSFEEIKGYLRSTSVCSDQVLGPSFPAFVAELRDALGGPPDAFRERIRWSYTLGRRPA